MTNQKKLTDSDPMPFGKHKGSKMANVPADYLLFLYNKDLPDGNVKEYIFDNLEALEAESFDKVARKERTS